jgi:hypothetical protein
MKKKQQIKKILRKKVHFYLDWGYGVSIEKIEKDLEELKKLGAVDIEICIEQDTEIRAFTYQEETDEEYNNRLKKESEWLKRKENEKLILFQILKAKYETSS